MQFSRSARRIFYVAAAGDITQAFFDWTQHRATESKVSLTYSASMFDMFARNGFEATSVSPAPEARSFQHGRMRAINLPLPSGGRRAVFYVNWLRRSLRLTAMILRFRPAVLAISDRAIFWPMLLLPRLMGTKVVHIMHVGLFNEHAAPSRAQRIMLWLERRVLRFVSSGLIAVSEQVAGQARSIADRRMPVDHFRPRWDRRLFDRLPEKSSRETGRPFRILFSGRVEWEKGVFDLLGAVQWLIEQRGADVMLVYCGTGGALEALRERVAALGLQDRVLCHGLMRGDAVIAEMGRCDVVVVPTRSIYTEGLNKVVVEAVLARRPVVTSRVCQALALVGEAASEAAIDDWLSYAREIERLMTDGALYDRRVATAVEIRETFLVHERDIGQVFEAVLRQSP